MHSAFASLVSDSHGDLLGCTISNTNWLQPNKLVTFFPFFSQCKLSFFTISVSCDSFLQNLEIGFSFIINSKHGDSKRTLSCPNRSCLHFGANVDTISNLEAGSDPAQGKLSLSYLEHLQIMLQWCSH